MGKIRERSVRHSFKDFRDMNELSGVTQLRALYTRAVKLKSFTPSVENVTALRKKVQLSAVCQPRRPRKNIIWITTKKISLEILRMLLINFINFILFYSTLGQWHHINSV